jgi:hypothetical protein
VFEYRLFEEPLLPDEWPGLATAIGTVVQMVNARGKVVLSPEDRQKATPPAPSLKELCWRRP